MSAKDTVRRHKTAIHTTLSGDPRLILNKVYERSLITAREYHNLKSINKEDVEGHVVALVDRIMNKGENTCQAFLSLLHTDEDIRTTYPDLEALQLKDTLLLPAPVQVCSSDRGDDLSPKTKMQKRDERYEVSSQPAGLCLIINNSRFMDGTERAGTHKDAESLAEVFSWLGFRVLMCKDQTQDQMERALRCFSSLRDLPQLQEFNVQEFLGCEFADLQVAPNHGDAFVCCILSHGGKGLVYGVDFKPLPIKQITRAFRDCSPLVDKPKVFLIQACQGAHTHRGALLPDLQADDSSLFFIPEEADVLVAVATVEDYKAMRHTIDGSWFVQSVCEQLRDGCLRGDDVTTILHHVNDDVSRKEGSRQPGAVKQMPEVRFTLRRRLVLPPPHNRS
ncbi:caspase-8-like [Aulostomus maculatus]